MTIVIVKNLSIQCKR